MGTPGVTEMTDEPPRYRARTIHEQDPLLNAPCDVCGEPLLLDDVIVFLEDDGSHAWHERHHGN